MQTNAKQTTDNKVNTTKGQGWPYLVEEVHRSDCQPLVEVLAFWQSHGAFEVPRAQRRSGGLLLEAPSPLLIATWLSSRAPRPAAPGPHSTGLASLGSALSFSRGTAAARFLTCQTFQLDKGGPVGSASQPVPLPTLFSFPTIQRLPRQNYGTHEPRACNDDPNPLHHSLHCLPQTKNKF